MAEIEDTPSAETVLVQVTGVDRPGIVAGVLDQVAQAEGSIRDIEQIVISGQISLSLVVAVPPGRDLLKDLLLFGWENDLQIGFEPASAELSDRRPGWTVTVVGAELSAADLHQVTSAIALSGTNIDRIIRLSTYPVWSYELVVSGGTEEVLKANLLHLATHRPGVDLAVQREGLSRRAQRLVVIDVDSTLIQNEVIDLLADTAGVGEEVAALTEAAMQGELDFEPSLRQRVGLLGGQPVGIIDAAWERVEFTPGARTFIRTLRSLGFRVAIVSGGFTSFTDRIRDELDLDYAYANTLEHKRGVLTGNLTGRIVDRLGKAEILREIAASEGLELSQVVAIGDGANDLDMLEVAGLGIAFNAKGIVRDVADTTISVPYLDSVLYFLGVRREDVESAGLTPADPPPV